VTGSISKEYQSIRHTFYAQQQLLM